MPEVTQLLEAANHGDLQAAHQLLPLVYEELRKLAAAKMQEEKPGQTLQATALVHEAYLKLIGDQQFEGRGHFFAAASEAMRRILVDSARRKARIKHGKDAKRIELQDEPAALPDEELLTLDTALTKLSARDPMKAEVVKLRYFGGMTMPEIATHLSISLATVERYWMFARAWLFSEMNSEK
jgi:RNA polymerase sigma factor (TIGR02999 family)